MDTPTCDELLRRLRSWVAANYQPAGYADLPSGYDREEHERVWDEAIEIVVGEEPERVGARPLTADQRELVITAFGELRELAQAADEHTDPREATDRERTAAACVDDIFKSREDSRAFAEGLPRGEYDDQLRFAYLPVVNWFTNIGDGLQNMTLDLAGAVDLQDSDSEFIRKELGLS